MESPFTLFLSDTHLQAHTPKANQCFLQLMAGPASHADAVYILGDLFEYWVGDDDNSAFNEQIKTSLWQLTQANIPVYIMPGNRDFLIGEDFCADTGATLLDDPTLIDCYGQSALLMHGDSLCTLDHKHQAFRKKTKNPYYRRAFLALPLWCRQRIAQRIRVHSYQRGQSLNPVIADVYPDTVEQTLQDAQPDLMIHGHTHRCATHEHRINNQIIKRYVLDSWHKHGQALVMQPNQPPLMTTWAFNVTAQKAINDLADALALAHQ